MLKIYNPAILQKTILTLRNNNNFNEYFIEKDYYLDFLLYSISKNERLSDILIFKGLTSLSKGYFDYYRMSEDLDFSVNMDSKYLDINFNEYNALSKNQQRKKRSQIADIIMDEIFRIIYEELIELGIVELNYEDSISNNKDIETLLKHNETKLIRFNVGYNSVITNQIENVLIEIAFSPFEFIPGQLKLTSLFQRDTIEIKTHNINQIFSEKYSAMTNRSYRDRRIAIRDFFDIQFLYPLVKNNINDIIPVIANIYIYDYNKKKAINGFVEIKGILDFLYDFDFMKNEIYKTKNDLLYPAPNYAEDFLDEDNIDRLYHDIYLPIQLMVKEYLQCPKKKHISDFLGEIC